MEEAPAHSTPPVATANPQAPKQSSSLGAIITILVIVAILVIGALYTWGQRVSEEQPQENGLLDNTQVDVGAQAQ